MRGEKGQRWRFGEKAPRAEKKTYHEITLDVAELVGETLLLGVVGGTLDLVVVVVQTNDVCAGELDHFSCWATNTTSNIQNLHTLLHAHDVGEVVLVTCDCLFERLAEGESAEVEGLTPAIFVKIGCEVVVVSGESGVLCFTGL